MGCACNRQNVRCLTSSANDPPNFQPTDHSTTDSLVKKKLKSTLIDSETAILTGKLFNYRPSKEIDIAYKCNNKANRYSCLKGLDDSILCHILNYIFNIKSVVNFIRARRISKDVPTTSMRKYTDQVKDFYSISTSMKRIHKIVYSMLNRPMSLANNNTIVVSKLFSFIGDEDDSTQFYCKKGRSLSPRSLLYTNKKLPDIKNFNNYATIKDIADEVDHEQNFVRRISKFKSFG